MNDGIDEIRLDAPTQWLAINGPGPAAFKECRTQFTLGLVDMTKVCAMAAEIRRTKNDPILN